jgi:hypothetical protein
MIRHLIAASLFAISSSAIAHPALDAIASADKSRLQELHYRTVETSTVNGKAKKTIARHDPSAPSRWTLESINGRAPTSTEQADFRSRKKSAAEPKLGDMIDTGSLKLLDKDTQARRWSFRFKEGKQIDGMDLEKLSGIVTIGDAGEAAAIDLNLESSMRMKLVIKISRLNFHTEYTRLPNGEVIERSSDMAIDGSAAVISVNQRSHTSFELINAANGS